LKGNHLAELIGTKIDVNIDFGTSAFSAQLRSVVLVHFNRAVNLAACPTQHLQF